MRLLLISNSTNPGEAFLTYPLPFIKEFLGGKSKNAIFIPFAAVSFSYDEFEAKVKERFGEIGINISSIHHSSDPIGTIEDADCIVVGGGNTFHLLATMYDKRIMEVIKRKVNNGVPFIGWSAGSNVACPTICTTNDMPIIQPNSFQALSLIPFQINPHYLDAHPSGHAGETREQRIMEFIEVNKNIHVAGLREGCMLKIENNSILLIGNRTLRVFKYGQETREFGNNDDLNFLLAR